MIDDHLRPHAISSRLKAMRFVVVVVLVMLSFVWLGLYFDSVYHRQKAESLFAAPAQSSLGPKGTSGAGPHPGHDGDEWLRGLPQSQAHEHHLYSDHYRHQRHPNRLDDHHA